MIDLASILVLVNLVVIIAAIIAGRVVLRSSIAKAETEVQTRVREALSAENELLRGRVQRLETENKRQGKVMQLIITTLKKLHSIDIDIDEDVITLRSPNGNVSRISTDTI